MSGASPLEVGPGGCGSADRTVQLGRPLRLLISDVTVNRRCTTSRSCIFILSRLTPCVSTGDVTTCDTFQTHQYACYIVPNYLLVNDQVDELFSPYVDSSCHWKRCLPKQIKIDWSREFSIKIYSLNIVIKGPVLCKIHFTRVCLTRHLTCQRSPL